MKTTSSAPPLEDMMNKNDSDYPTPPSISRYKWFEKDLDKKADQKWVEAKLDTVDAQFSNLDSEAKEAKKIALSAKKKADMPHECVQKDAIEKTATTVEGWAKWWRGILISVIGFLVVIGGSWLYQYFTLTSEVSGTKDTVDELKVTVKNIETSQEELKRAFDESEVVQERQREEHIRAVRSVMKEVLKEVKNEPPVRANIQPGRSRRTN